jgi:hypothetical protein
MHFINPSLSIVAIAEYIVLGLAVCPTFSIKCWLMPYPVIGWFLRAASMAISEKAMKSLLLTVGFFDLKLGNPFVNDAQLGGEHSKHKPCCLHKKMLCCWQLLETTNCLRLRSSKDCCHSTHPKRKAFHLNNSVVRHHL